MRQGEIWVNKTLAGILTEDDNGYHFKYDKAYLENENSLAVSLTLPLQEEPFSAEIGRKVYYFYSDINFTINNQPLTESEAQELKETLITLNRYKGLPQFEWIESMTTRLEASFQLLNLKLLSSLFKV